MHTLFESGTTRIYELDRYIKDDVIRYGGRLAELEKKLANAYRDAVSRYVIELRTVRSCHASQTTEEAWDDDALFQNANDEEEDGQFVMYVDWPVIIRVAILTLIVGATLPTHLGKTSLAFESWA